MTIGPFRGEYRWLSNFYRPAPVKAVWYKHPDGTPVLVDVPTVEHGYVLAKHADYGRGALKEVGVGFADFYHLMAGQAKRLGRKITLREDWNEVRVDVMRWLLEQKFAWRSDLGWKLVHTEFEELVELNHWHDNFWGRCTCDGCSYDPPDNRLGELLMEIRTNLWRLVDFDFCAVCEHSMHIKDATGYGQCIPVCPECAVGGRLRGWLHRLGMS